MIAISAPCDRDTVAEFESSRVRIDELVNQLSSAHAGGLQEAEGRSSLVPHLEAIRRAIFAHFAREREALLPFVRLHIAKCAGMVLELEVAHERICLTLSRLLDLASMNMQDSLVFELFYEYFHSAYDQHRFIESSLFREVARVFDGDRDQQLAVRGASEEDT